MNRVILCALYISVCLIGVFAVPVPTEPHEIHKPGDYVGVRAKAYEEKNPHVVSINPYDCGIRTHLFDRKLDKISIHPGVVMEGLDPETGKYPVAMISKKLPNNPPRKDIKAFHPNMKPWKDDKTGVRHIPMQPHELHSLKEAMAWRHPTPLRCLRRLLQARIVHNLLKGRLVDDLAVLPVGYLMATQAAQGILLLALPPIITVHLQVLTEEDTIQLADMDRQVVHQVVMDRRDTALRGLTLVALAEGRHLLVPDLFLRRIPLDGRERRGLYKHDGVTHISVF
ncbi:hypothetical protein CPB84DRAFT_1960305 [Gymnopilus junonius]|uniref:Uncharacterized protein n=1 Tax=Gymnopilus junonius TaxID=109634 RepID=A0A9P5NTF1_GYMJU|nr:hypothetical protein CPB84DRAFT_1960305 [Gymnopilus junonius]